MATGMWTAVSGAAAQAQSVDVIANNIANAETVGFKKDTPTFKEYLAVEERDGGGTHVAPGPIKNRDLYLMDGRDKAHVVVDGTHTVHRQGTLRVTDSPFDVAIDGKGFLEVSTPSGVRYTRQGSLKQAMDGRLVTSEGYPVLAAGPGGLDAGNQEELTAQGRAPASIEPNAENVAARFINLADAKGRIHINEQGEIYSGGEQIAKLGVAHFSDLSKLKKVGSSMYENVEPGNRAPETASPSRVLQGMIETSNVNPAEEMVNLIKANRLYEQNLKAIKTYNDMMGREANDVGRL